MRRVDEPFSQQLKRVRVAKGLTLERLAFRVQDIAAERGERGISRDAIAQLEGKPRRQPREVTVLLLGEALEAQPGEFQAYDLALARRAFDERAVGTAAALANLRRVRDVIPTITRLAQEADAARRRPRRG